MAEFGGRGICIDRRLRDPWDTVYAVVLFINPLIQARPSFFCIDLVCVL